MYVRRLNDVDFKFLGALFGLMQKMTIKILKNKIKDDSEISDTKDLPEFVIKFNKISQSYGIIDYD